jgi:exopolyphosphatase/guanosine-5'-triphosphate,3'-diphosphate pyrophosphatase
MRRKPEKSRPAPAAERASDPRRPVAVVEIGTTSIRMLVAEIGAQCPLKVLDSLQQPVALGKDTFTRGFIDRPTIETCVKALRSFQRVLEEYGIRDENDVRAIATSAVREATNREAFVDRIYIGTGLALQVIDQAAINRYTYLAVKPVLESERSLQASDTLVIEVGGGSTEALMFRRGRVGSAHMYRLGSLRLRRMLADYRVSEERVQTVLDGHVNETVEQIMASISPVRKPALLALGGDARFACAWVSPGWDRRSLTRLAVAPLVRLTHDVLKHSTDELVRQYEMTYPDAETAGPALLVYARLARALSLRHIHVCDASLRYGVLAEMASGGAWTREFQEQIINSALTLGRRYEVDPHHAGYVADLAGRLFTVLQPEHRLDPRYGILLHAAALLHETGQFVSRSSHHKHSMYIILNSDLFGLGSEEILLTALVARYHRRAHPNPIHEHYADLDREDRIRVSKLAAILRVADAMDSGRRQRLRNATILLENDRLVIRSRRSEDLTLEKLQLREKAQLFEQVYGMQVALESE